MAATSSASIMLKTSKETLLLKILKHSAKMFLVISVNISDRADYIVTGSWLSHCVFKYKAYHLILTLAGTSGGVWVVFYYVIALHS
jgi:hypothetical protein